MKKFLGYIAWDFALNEPKSGTRRFKVWTTEREAGRGIPEGSNRYGVKPVYVEVEA
ncbi:hypothetical protein SAMN02927900_04778 [Rhizobium mongolense subsp. loessense]|uniref:Uncharacterized protein n=1 Tax=Rhizobium mongolense subsp. loessense TaxID=158890 RepID=A0A1G4T9E3_9HYPH|nr:hypothetical protein [Rhizobium mongolense]SCW77169.1 hypothetical protein SAMN02927900_04778 [Rhizobium mongolense subsp. loessense]